MPQKKLTQEEFEKRVYELFGDKYKVLGKYTNSDTRIKIKHLECGNEFEVVPYTFYKSTGCPICARKQKGISLRLGVKGLQEKMDKKFPGDYMILSNESEYKTNQSPLKIRHNVCGYEWITSALSLNNYKTSMCPQCRKEWIETKWYEVATRNRNTYEEIKSRVESMYDGTYKLLSDTYVDNKTKIKLKHLVCGNEFEVRPSNFLRKDGSHCPVCQRKLVTQKTRKTHEEFLEEMNNKRNDMSEYEILSRYIKNTDFMTFKHIPCGHEFKMRAMDFRHNQGCPYCAHRKGITGDEIRTQLQELVGDKFQLVSNEDGSVTN